MKAVSVATRRAVLWIPDWPVVAALAEAKLGPETTAAVLHGRGLLAVSASARAAGVTRGMRKRQAQSRCPNVVLLPHDQGRDARAFEAVAAAAEQVVAGVEITRPGLLMIPANGASRFHGSEEALAEALVTAVAEYAGYECSVGAADGLLAAVVAARSAELVPPGASAQYLSTLPIEVLSLASLEKAQRAGVEDLVSVLTRLGIFTLGEYVSLPAADVLARFGAVGMWARRMAMGQDVAPPVVRRQEQEIAAEYIFEEPAENVQQLAAVAEHVSAQLDGALLEAGVRCGRVRISASTVKGDTLERVWRTDVGSRSGAFARHMTDRVRWQLEGWLSGTANGPERAPLTALIVTAEEVVPLGAEQAYLWGGSSGADARARRTVERVQSLLGLEGVLAVREQGGRTPKERVQALAWGQESPPARRLDHPWPGRIPEPAPATVLPVPLPLRVLDAAHGMVIVDRRLGLSAPPTWVAFSSSTQGGLDNAIRRHPASGTAGRQEAVTWLSPRPVEAWAGPWPIVQRWWAEDASRRAYMQIVVRGQAKTGESDLAILVAFVAGEWLVEAIYD